MTLYLPLLIGLAIGFASPCCFQNNNLTQHPADSPRRGFFRIKHMAIPAPPLHSVAHYKKLLGLYEIDLALVRDGYRPASLACEIMTRGMTPAEAQEFIEWRIGVIIARIIQHKDH